MLILRSKKTNKKQIKEAIKYAESQLGRPFDFEFKYKRNAKRFYCTELLYCSLTHAGIKTDLLKNKKSTLKILRPINFVNNNFKIVFKSHNLEVKNAKVKLIEKNHTQIKQTFSRIYKNWIIRKFPKNFSLWGKIKANTSYLIGRVIIRKGANHLSKHDHEMAGKKLQKGDIVLTGGFRRLVNFLIGKPLNHAALYIGNGKLIHSIGISGVAEITLEDLLYEYDTLMILRYKKPDTQKINKAIDYAKKQISKSFDFHFKEGAENLYCSELIYVAYQKAGFKMDVLERQRFTSILGKLKNIHAIHPQDFIGGNFKTTFMSHNLRIKEGVVILLNKKEVAAEKKLAIIKAKEKLTTKVRKGLKTIENIEEKLEGQGEKTIKKTIKNFKRMLRNL